jgi:transposase
MKKSISTTKKNRFWVGMDDHAATIVVAVLKDEETAPVARFTVSNDDRGQKELIKRLRELKGEVRCVYEAGPCGYGLQRRLTKAGLRCDVAAPSLTPQRPGRRVKTDRRDALKQAEMLRGNLMTMVTIPDVEREALRDLVRAREDTVGDLLQARNRLSKLLLRHGQQYREGNRWTKGHWRWIHGVKLEQAHSQAALDQYITVVNSRLDQLDAITKLLKAAAEEHQQVISRYCALRGVDWLTALTIYAEYGDLRRYESAPSFMDSLGLVPVEDSSGPNHRRGSITKTGNAHARRVLVESAWHARHYPRVGATLRKRRQNLPPEVVRIAEKAEVRLHRKFSRMLYRNKRSTVAAVAVARELSGFLWAIAQLP